MLSLFSTKKSTEDLSTQIKKVIGYRILACFLLAVLALSTMTVIEVVGSFHLLETKIGEKSKNLEGFIVSQFLNQNQEAIQVKFDTLKEKNSSTQFIWHDGINNTDMQQKMQWKFPFLWKYTFPVYNIDKSFLGYIEVNGSFLDIQDDLLKKILLLLIFFVTILAVLYPLSKRIPQQLFIVPINNLIALLHNDKNFSNELMQNLPIEIDEIKNRITSLLKSTEQRSREAAFGLIATQVAHDIRSPLAVLNIETKDLSFLPEKNRINIRNAIQRVNDIANNLLSQYRKYERDENLLSSESVFMMLENIVSEKRIETKETEKQIILDISPDAYGVFINANLVSFKRVLSNIINNSIEAIANDGIITIKLTKSENKVSIDIIDNGLGIPQDKLSLITTKGVSFGKTEGSGLGLSYAIGKINSWDGEYAIDSMPGKGTQFRMIFPESKQPPWFAHEINIAENSTVVILDDDDFIHQAWDERFTESFKYDHKLNVKHFNNPNDLIDYCKQSGIKGTFFLFDNELIGYKETGLMLAEKFNLGASGILVTSRYEDPEVRMHCEKIDMRILPKFITKYTPIRLVKKTDIVFIDDDETITSLWKDSAERSGIKIATFNNTRDFMNVHQVYDKDVLIYIDSSLGEGIKGENVARTLYDKGYKNIILATGFAKTEFINAYWLKDVVDKIPPWG